MTLLASIPGLAQHAVETPPPVVLVPAFDTEAAARDAAWAAWAALPAWSEADETEGAARRAQEIELRRMLREGYP